MTTPGNSTMISDTTTAAASASVAATAIAAARLIQRADEIDRALSVGLRMFNVGLESLVLIHQHSGAARPNRFISPTAEDVVVAANESVDLEYDAISERWRILRAP